MDISITFDLQDGQRKLVKGGMYRFEISMGGMRVYGFRYDPSTGNILCPQSEDKTGRKHQSANITKELEEEIVKIINGGNSEEVAQEQKIPPELKKQMEEDAIRRKEHYKKLGKIQ